MIDIKIGDCRKLIHELDNESIDCVMTSPPYWGLRDYGNAHIIFDGKLDCDHSWDGQKHVFKMSGGTGKTDVGNYSDDRLHFERETNFCSKCGAWRGQLGLEPTPELYIKHVLDFFDDVKLKLKAEGNCFVNLGDSYMGGGQSNGRPADSITNFKISTVAPGVNSKAPTSFKHKLLKPKCLCMIPQRFAWGMIERGWILRNIIIWWKPNHMPESVRDRWTKAHEDIYYFTKIQKNYFNLDAIREPHNTESIERYKRSVELGANAVQGKILQREEQNLGYPRHAPKWFIEGQNPESFGSPRARTQRKVDDSNSKWKDAKTVSKTNNQDYTSLHRDGVSEGVNHPIGKNPGDVWSITTKPYPESHFAVFPLELVRKPILAGCPVGGTVLDPFGGSGTVGEFCRHNERNAILFELNPEYVKLIKERSMADIPELDRFV